MANSAELIELDELAELVDRSATIALELAKATIAARDDRIVSLESEREFLLEEIAYCVERLRNAGVMDGITETNQ